MLRWVSVAYSQLQFSHFDIEDGLPSSEVETIAHDSYGYIWIGTYNGLCKYDGYTFETMREGDSVGGLVGTTVFKVFEDSRKVLWIGTNKTLLFFERQKNEFIPVAQLKNTCIVDIDEASDGNLWILTLSGLFLYDHKKGTIVERYDTSNGLPTISLANCVIDSHQTIWIATNSDGLFSFNSNSRTFVRHMVSLPTNRLKCLTFATDGKLWIGTFDAGICVLDTTTNSYIRYYHDPKKPGSLGFNHVSQVFFDSRDNAWVACQNGFLNLLNRQTGTFTKFEPQPWNDRSIQSNSISCMVEDPFGNLWIGSYGAGMQCLNKSQNNFELNTISVDAKSGPQISNILDIEAFGNKLLVGSDGGGVYCFDPASKKFSSFYNQAIGSLHMTDLMLKGDLLWCATWGNGVKLLNVKTGASNMFAEGSSASWTLPNNNIRMVNVMDDHLWIGSYGDGLMLVDLKDNKLKSRGAANKYGMELGRAAWVTHSLQDSRGRIWVTSLFGVRMFDGKKMHTFLFDSANVRSISNDVIYSVYEDSKKQLWFMSAKGLDKFDERGGMIRYGFDKGMPANAASMLEDNDHNLWVSSESGLICFNETTGLFRKFDWHDGLPRGRFNANSAVKSPDGRLYFGHKKGLVSFDPRSLFADTLAPRVSLRNFYIDYKLQHPGEKKAIRESIEFIDTLVLPFSSSVLTFDIIDRNKLSSQKASFSYFIEGISHSWIVMNDNRSISFSNMPPGTYSLKVKACYVNNKCDEKDIKIIIIPPWWRTKWFKLLVFLTLLLVALLIYLIKIRMVEHQNAVLRAKVDEKTCELTQAIEELSVQNNILAEKEFLLQIRNDEMQKTNATKDKLFSIIAHDLKNPIGAMMGITNTMKKNILTVSPDKLQTHVDSLSKSATSLYGQVEMLLNWSRSQTRSIACKMVDINVEQMVRESVSLFGELAESKEISISLDLRHGHHAHADLDMITIVLRNLLSNALKFTPRKGHITVATHSTSEVTVIQVQDSGAGLSTLQIDRLLASSVNDSVYGTDNEKGTGLGIVICRDFLNCNKSKLEVQSVLGRGSVFAMHIPSGSAVDVMAPCQPAELVDDDQEEGLQLVSDTNLHLLIVEDNDEIRQYMVDLFYPYYAVITAKNGDEGFDQALQHVPDLIITDVMMPGTNGIDMCAKIKAEPILNHIPVIILSAQDTEETQAQGLISGAYDFIPKPFKKNILLLKVRSILESRNKYKEFLKKQFVQEPSSIFSQSPEDKFLLSVHAVLEKNFRDPDFSIEKFAVEMGYSRSQLFRKLKAIIDTTPIDYLKLFRLKRAKEMIDSGNWRVSELAYDVGFNDPVYFSNCFKQQYGFPPNHFIKNKGV